MPDIDLENSVLVDTHVAARILGLSYGALANWRHKKKGPPFYKVGDKVRYRIEDLNAFVEESRVEFNAPV